MIKMKKVWDNSIVRLNWLSALSLVGIVATVGAAPLLHQFFVSVLFITVALRAFHGFKGSQTARFSTMIFPVSDILLHIHDLKSFRPQSWFGHSPLGGLFALLSLLGLGATAVSGLLATSTLDALALHVTLTSLSLALWSAYALGAVLNLLSNGDSLVNYTLSGQKSVIVTKNTQEETLAPQTSTKALSLGLGFVLALFMVVPLVSQTTQAPISGSSAIVATDMNFEAQALSEIETAAGFRMEMNLDTPVDAKEVVGRTNVRSGTQALPSQNEEAPATTSLEDISIEIPVLKQ